MLAEDHSKITSFRKGGERLTKKVTKSDIVGEGVAKKVMSFTQNFSVPIFSATHVLLFCIPLPNPKNYNLTVLPTWCVNICESMCKSECAHRLKL